MCKKIGGVAITYWDERDDKQMINAHYPLTD